MNKAISFFIFFLKSIHLLAQVDSVFVVAQKKDAPFFVPYKSNSLKHQYHSILSKDNFYAYRGNYGAAVKSFLFNQVNTATQDFTFSEYMPYLYHVDSVLFYDTKRPYTTINWVNGLKKEQNIRLVHAQNITPRWNVSFDFNRYRNNGYFLRHLSNNAHASACTKYFSKKRNYTLHAVAVFNSIKQQENGGVDSFAFTRLQFIDKKSIAPNLIDAFRNNSQWSFLVNNKYFLFSKNDTSNNKKQPFGFYVSLENRLNRIKQQYADANADINFYRKLTVDSLRIYDSNYVVDQNHLLSFGYTSKKLIDSIANIFDLSTGIGLQNVRIDFFQRKKNELYVHTINNNNLSNLFWKTNALFSYKSLLVDFCNILTLYGYNNKDIVSNASANYKFKENNINLKVQNSNTSPNYFENIFISNTSSWNNNFNKTNVFQLTVNYSNDKLPFTLSLFSNSINNYIYYDSTASIVQLNNQITNNGLKLTTHLKIKKLHWQSWLVLQTNSNSSVIVLPSFMIRSALYFEFKLFKKALPLQVGAEHYYIAKHNGYGYMPSIYKYYMSNNFTTQNYQYIDVFLNSTIGQAQIFLKVEHVLSGLLGNGYYLVKNSPVADRAIKFGVSWFMYN